MISGQYVIPNNFVGSTEVEIEIFGIDADSHTVRTKLVQRNSVNPIWDERYEFKVSHIVFLYYLLYIAVLSNCSSGKNCGNLLENSKFGGLKIHKTNINKYILYNIRNVN